MKKRFHLSTLQLALACLPFVLGVIGFALYYSDTMVWTMSPFWSAVQIGLNSAYSAIRLYGFAYDVKATDYLVPSVHVLLETARWLALAATTSAFVTVFKNVTARMKNYARTFNPNAIGLHADATLLPALKMAIKHGAIIGETPETLRARTHILAFEKEESLYRYLNEHFQDLNGLPGRRLYLCSLNAQRAGSVDGSITISNIAENCARQYWKNQWLRTGETTIVFIGSGRYTSSLLKQALLTNVFTQGRPIAYHVFSTDDDFVGMHTGLEKFVSLQQTATDRDSLWFHREPWQQSRELLALADRVILCDQEEEHNIHSLDRLLEHNTVRRIDIRARDSEVIAVLWPPYTRKGIIVKAFGTDQELYNREVICEEQLLRTAKLIHANYLYTTRNGEGLCGICTHNPEQCLRCATFAELWNALSPFLQDSNIAQADHMESKVRQTLGEDVEVTPEVIARFVLRYEQMPLSQKQKLWKLEHDRWLRFMYFHGWEYAPVRDNKARKHPLLLPYEELDEAEWNKDAQAYTTLRSLVGYEI